MLVGQLRTIPVSHPQVNTLRAQGQLATLADFIQLGALSTTLATTGHTPYLLLFDEETALGQYCITVHYIYSATGRCNPTCNLCHVELHNGWFTYPSDAAIYWASEDQEEQDFRNQ